MKLIFILLIVPFLAFAGKITTDEVATKAGLEALGSTMAKLPSDAQIYITAKNLNKQLSEAITAGDIGGDAFGLTNYTKNSDINYNDDNIIST